MVLPMSKTVVATVSVFTFLGVWNDYLWPSLKAHGLDDIGIYLWDHNKERVFEWAETIIDTETTSMIRGWHFTGTVEIISKHCA